MVEGFKHNENNNLTLEARIALGDGKISKKEAVFMLHILDKYGRKNVKINKKILDRLAKYFGLSKQYNKLILTKIGPLLKLKIKKAAGINKNNENKLNKLYLHYFLKNSVKDFNGLPGRTHHIKKLRQKTIKQVTKDFPSLPKKEKRELFKTIMKSKGIKLDCYSFVYHIAKKMKNKFPILNKFIYYNRKYNNERTGYKGSMTQFLSRIEKVKSLNFRTFMDILKNSPNNSMFLVSMNTRGEPYFEHTGFITKENGRIFFTHGETFKKSGAQGTKKTEIKEKSGYFNSTYIRRRYKQGYFHLKRIA